jgi:hypothetical protein
MASLKPPLDPRKVEVVRAFLRTHYPGAELIDRFDGETEAQRFTLNPGRATKHTLLVPRETLEDPDLASLLTEVLIEALKRAGARPVTLTTKGIRYEGKKR